MLPTAELEVSGLKKKVTIKALIDTGFSGALCLPAKTALELGLVLSGKEEFELANGEWLTQFYFKGQVHFLGQTREVDIVVTNSETPQLGVSLLQDCRLTIDFPSNKVQITRKKA